VRRARRDVVGFLRCVQAGGGFAEGRPATGGQPVRFLPFGKLGHPLQDLAHQLEQELARQPRCQGVHRLQHRQVGARLRRHDIIRMRHLQRVAVKLNPSRDVADAADRQLPLDEFALDMKEDEVDLTGLVLAGDPIRRSHIAARRPLVLEHSHGECRDRARYGAGDSGLGTPVDDASRGVPQKVDDARLGYTGRQAQRFLQQQEHPWATPASALR